jgi:hypothetical protein
LFFGKMSRTAFLILACLHVQTAGSAVKILEPLDGDLELPHSFNLHYRAHIPGRVSCFIGGRRVFTSAEQEERLQIPYLPLGFHTLEVQLTSLGGEVQEGEGEPLGYDVVEVFVLGDGKLAPVGVDDDLHVQEMKNVTGIAAEIDVAIQLATSAAAGKFGGDSLAKISQAEAELERIISVLANVPGDLVPLCYYSMAQVLLARGDASGLERAIAALRDAIWHSPAHGEAHYLLAVLLAHQHRAIYKVSNGGPVLSVVRGDETRLIQAHAQTALRLLRLRAASVSASLSPTLGKLYIIYIIRASSKLYIIRASSS